MIQIKLKWILTTANGGILPILGWELWEAWNVSLLARCPSALVGTALLCGPGRRLGGPPDATRHFAVPLRTRIRHSGQHRFLQLKKGGRDGYVISQALLKTQNQCAILTATVPVPAVLRNRIRRSDPGLFSQVGSRSGSDFFDEKVCIIFSIFFSKCSHSS